MDFAPAEMELAGPPSSTSDWWRSIQQGDFAAVVEAIADEPLLVESQIEVVSMATASARRVSAVSVTPLIVACDLGHASVVQALLQFGSDPYVQAPLRTTQDSDYEPDKDDFRSWLLPLTALDRALERGHGNVVRVLLGNAHSPEKWCQMSARCVAMMGRHAPGRAVMSSQAVAIMYAAGFAGSHSAATEVLRTLKGTTTPDELAQPLAIALSRGSAGVAQCLIDLGADKDAPPSTQAQRESEQCQRPLCVAARALNNPACAAVLLRAGAAVHHPHDTDTGAIAHFAWEEAGMALYRFENHVRAGTLNIPDRAIELARAAAKVYSLACDQVPLQWTTSSHHRYPCWFRREVRGLLCCLYLGKWEECKENDDDVKVAEDVRVAVQIFRALPEHSLRNSILKLVITSFAQRTVWDCLPADFWR